MRHVYYGSFEFYNALGRKLGERVFSAGDPVDNWVEFTGGAGELITTVVVHTRQHSFTDNWELYF